MNFQAKSSGQSQARTKATCVHRLDVDAAGAGDDRRLDPGPEPLHGREGERAGDAARRRPARRVPERGAAAAPEQGDDARIDDRVHRIGRGEHGAHQPVGHEVDAELGPAQLRRRGRRQRERIGRAGHRHRQHPEAEAQSRPQLGARIERDPGRRRGEIGAHPAPAEQRKQRRGDELQDDEGDDAAREHEAGDDHRRVDDDLDPRPAVELLRRLQVPRRRPAEGAGERGDGERIGERMGVVGRAPLHRGEGEHDRRQREHGARGEDLLRQAAPAGGVGADREPRRRGEEAALDQRRQQAGPDEDEAEPAELARADARRDQRQDDDRQHQPHRRGRVDLRQRGEQARRRRGRRHARLHAPSCLTTRRAV